jgi:hypothetical protein
MINPQCYSHKRESRLVLQLSSTAERRARRHLSSFHIDSLRSFCPPNDSFCALLFGLFSHACGLNYKKEGRKWWGKGKREKGERKDEGGKEREKGRGMFMLSAVFAAHWRGRQHRGACHCRTCSKGRGKIPPVVIVVLCSDNSTSHRPLLPLVTLSTARPPLDEIAATAHIVPSNACSCSCWHCYNHCVAVVVTAAVAATTSFSLPHNNAHPCASAGARGAVSDGGHSRSRAPSPPLRFATRPPQHMLIVTSLFKPDTNALLPRQRHTHHHMHTLTTLLLPQQPNRTPATFVIPPRHCRPAAAPTAPPHQTR